MKLSVYCISKLKKSPEYTLIQDYKKRIDGLVKQTKMGELHFYETDAPKGFSGDSLKHEEAKFLMNNYTPQMALIALDEHGATVTSTEFSQILQNLRDKGITETRFVIGGACGLHDSILKTATHTIAFGKMTLPHLLARVLLAEQIYRAATLAIGHPYHRE